MVGPMADPPAFNPCAYEPPVSLWRLIEQFAPEHERQELKQILGESMVDQSLELQEEVDTLLEIWRDYRCETYTESYQKRLPEPPQVRDRLKQEIKFFVENIRERANRQGVDPEKIFASHNKDVLTYALENADKPSTPSRPSTAVSRQGRETPMVISPASDRASLASTVSEEVECMNDKLNILEVDEVIQHLRSTLEEEVAQLVSDINFLQGCLDDEADFRAESSGNDFTEPSITALREERASLEKDLLKGDVPLPPTNKPALPPQLRKYTPLPKGTCGRQSENANISNVPSKLSPVKGNHELSPPSVCGGHEGKDASVRIKVAHPSARAHVVRITAVSDTDSVSDSGQMIPTPPLSSKPKHSRPGSADRFRKMVLQSRDEP